MRVWANLIPSDQVRARMLPYLAALAVSIAIIAFDFFLPLGVAAGVPYVGLVLIGIWLPSRHHVFILAVIGSVLTIAGYLMSPSGGIYWVVLTNRGLALSVIWVTAILIYLRKGAEEELVTAHQELEKLVNLRSVQLQESENRFHHFIQHAPDAVYVLDVEGNILSANNQACVETGYTQNELLKLSIRDITLNLSAGREKHIDRLRKEGHSTNYRTHRRKDGSTFEVEVRASYSEFGDQKNVITLVRNISERNRANETIRKLSSAVEQNPSMVIITDKDGTIEYVNPKFSELSGYDSQEAIGKKPSLLQSGVTPRETYTEMWATILAGREWRSEVLDKRKDGATFWVSASINAIKNEAGEITHFVSMEEDISERKRAEFEMQEAKEHAEIANRVKTDFLANMSHELRTPLNAIIGYSETLNHEIFGALANEKQKEYVETIYASGNHLLELINDILDVSAIEAGKLELHDTTIQLDKLSNAVMPLVQKRAEYDGVELINEIDHDAPVIRGDELRIKQILVNLLSNAVKFTRLGGTVSLAVDRTDDGCVDIIIRDTGIGMDATDIAKAMEKFGQAERGDLMQSGEGTGLGLPLTKGLIEAHGGKLHIQSKPDKGTIVSVSFPQQRVLN